MNYDLRNIEFFGSPEGGVMIRDGRGVRTYTQEEKGITEEIFSIIEEEYPKAFRALSEIYAKSRANIGYFKFLLVHRFLRCNFSQLDRRLDIDEFGRFQFEEVSCPLAGECKSWRVICSPERETKLTIRQKQVMQEWIACAREGVKRDRIASEVADRLFISEHTAKTTKRNAFDRIGVHSLAEFMEKTKETFAK